MPIKEINQPKFININACLRLRRYSDDCAFALSWYKDEETLMLVDGVNAPYDMDRLFRMYHYLNDRGEVYFIEYRDSEQQEFRAIGDVTFWQEDMPIVIGEKNLRGKGIGFLVVNALISRAKEIGYTYLEVAEIYSYNLGSRKLFEKAGFKENGNTENGHSFRLEMN